MGKVFPYQYIMMQGLVVILGYIMMSAPVGTVIYSQAGSVRKAARMWLEDADPS